MGKDFYRIMENKLSSAAKKNCLGSLAWLGIKKALKFLDFTGLALTVFQKRDLVRQLIKRNISVRYRGSFLGIFWSFANPLLMLGVYLFVFGVLFGSRWEGLNKNTDKPGAFALVMLCGLAIYNIFAETVNYSCNIIITNQNLVKKVVFPLELLSFVQVIATFLLGLVWFVLLFAGGLFVFGLHWTMLLLPVFLLPLILFSLGWSYIVSCFGTYIRDTQHVVSVLLQMLFFMSPIFYQFGLVEKKLQAAGWGWVIYILQLNPLVYIIEDSRRIFLFGELPANWWYVCLIYLISIVVFLIGFYWFRTVKKGFADVL